MHIDPAWIAVIGTAVGTIGLKVAEHFLSRGSIKVDDARTIRDELRLEVEAQRVEIKELDVAVDKWRADYYDLRDKYIEVSTKLTIALKDSPSPLLPPDYLPQPPRLPHEPRRAIQGNESTDESSNESDIKE